MKRTPHKTSHEENLARVNRIEGQIRGVRRMIEEREYCIDIITQIQAAQSALGAVARKIFEKHLDTCVSDALQSKNKTETDEKTRELMRVMKRMCR
ncbi:metal-sensitive transcriptional regulator [Verrucomicrobiota bacterium]